MGEISRRQFLYYLSGFGLSACAATLEQTIESKPIDPSQIKFKRIWDWGPLPQRVFPEKVPAPSVIGTSHAQNPNSFSVENLVREALEKAGDFDKMIRPGDRVLIKPNLVFDLPSGSGMTTDVRVAEAVAKMALDCGAQKIIFAEGSATNRGLKTYQKDVTEKSFVVGGYAHLAKKLGADLVDLNDAGEKPGGRELVRRVELKNGLKRKSYWISKHFLDVDRVISIPVLKNHRYAGVTLSLKNYIGVAPADIYQFPGILPGKTGLDHSIVGLAKHIVDLVMVRPPDYAVIDALVGISSGNRAYPYRPGPKGRMRAILAGRDPVAVDTVACLAMSYEPKTIGHLVFAWAVGLGISDPSKIEIRGIGIEPFRQDFPIPVASSWYIPGRYGQRPRT
jgi:uncharacterized protein (DUF362 family)